MNHGTCAREHRKLQTAVNCVLSRALAGLNWRRKLFKGLNLISTRNFMKAAHGARMLGRHRSILVTFEFGDLLPTTKAFVVGNKKFTFGLLKLALWCRQNRPWYY